MTYFIKDDCSYRYVYKTDTLKLKELMYQDEDWHLSQIEIGGKNIGTVSKNIVRRIRSIDADMHYINPYLNYALFTNDDRKPYRIK